jgi:site-specific recombinase XerD
MKTPVLKTSDGSVKPYTRHIRSCKHRNSADQNGCSCPKWLYENRKGERPVRRSLSTPSWAEAQRIAAQVLRGFDSEIAAARLIQKDSQQARMTVADACQLFVDRTEREFGKGGTHAQHRSTLKKFQTWASKNGIFWIQDVTALQLEVWYSSAVWKKLARSTQHQRWAVMRTMFAYLKSRKVIPDNPIEEIKPVKADAEFVQGPYSDEQVEKLLTQAKTLDVPLSVNCAEKSMYHDRLTAFITLLLHTGCDLADAVLFDPKAIEDVPLNGRMSFVFRYHRVKTGLLAVIPLTRDLAKILRNIPTVPGHSSSMPFGGSTKFWSERIRKCLKAAGIAFVTLPANRLGRVRTKPANAKQLRHTFAVRQLVQGQRPEEVAKMLGHANTEMVRKHYAPWVKELDMAHVRMVEERRMISLPNRGLSVVPHSDAFDEPLAKVSAS